MCTADGNSAIKPGSYLTFIILLILWKPVKHKLCTFSFYVGWICENCVLAFQSRRFSLAWMFWQCCGPSARCGYLNPSQLKAAVDAQYVTWVDFCPEETEASQCFQTEQSLKKRENHKPGYSPCFPMGEQPVHCILGVHLALHSLLM